MSAEYNNELVACAAILTAATILNWLPSDIRRPLFVLIFGTGALAAVAGLANAFGLEAVSRLFG